MLDGQKFPYKIIDTSSSMVDRMPYVPITLGLNGRSLNTEGLIDTGASVNVLPYELGLQLGFIWENENLSVILAGNLAHNLAFAWTQAPTTPLILGQANFLFEFDVCFSRSQSEFAVRPRTVV